MQVRPATGSYPETIIELYDTFRVTIAARGTTRTGRKSGGGCPRTPPALAGTRMVGLYRMLAASDARSTVTHFNGGRQGKPAGLGTQHVLGRDSRRQRSSRKRMFRCRYAPPSTTYPQTIIELYDSLRVSATACSIARTGRKSGSGRLRRPSWRWDRPLPWRVYLSEGDKEIFVTFAHLPSSAPTYPQSGCRGPRQTLQKWAGCRGTVTAPPRI